MSQNHNKMNTCNKSATSSLTSCKHCGYDNHYSNNCKYKKCKCNKCGKVGHMAQICRATNVNSIEENKKNMTDEQYSKNNIENFVNYNIKSFQNSKNVNSMQPIEVAVQVNGSTHTFQMDSGASICAVSLEYYRQNFLKIKLMSDDTLLMGYGKEKIIVAGCIFPKVSYNNISKVFKILIIKNEGPPIMGRNFLLEFRVKNISICNLINNYSTIDYVVNEFKDLFDDTIGKLVNNKVNLEVSSDIKAIFIKPVVPYAFVEKVNQQLCDLEKSGIITKVENSKWGTPLVLILKLDGNIRICADYKITANKFLVDMNYP